MEKVIKLNWMNKIAILFLGFLVSEFTSLYCAPKEPNFRFSNQAKIPVYVIIDNNESTLSKHPFVEIGAKKTIDLSMYDKAGRSLLSKPVYMLLITSKPDPMRGFTYLVQKITFNPSKNPSSNSKIYVEALDKKEVDKKDSWVKNKAYYVLVKPIKRKTGLFSKEDYIGNITQAQIKFDMNDYIFPIKKNLNKN